MEKKVSFLIVGLLIVASFLAGAIWTKSRSGGEKMVIGSQTEVQEALPTPPPFEPPKTDRPEVKFFVMSFCPFGNQAEAGLKPVYELLGDKVDWQPRYIVGKQGDQYASLHGQQELNQDVRELCVEKLAGIGKWWAFVEKVNENCTDKDADECWRAQAQAVAVRTYPVSSCEETQAKALLSLQVEEMEKYQAGASPMVFVNDTLYNGGRAPEDYKLAICSAFEAEPEECTTVLSATSEGTAGGCQ